MRSSRQNTRIGAALRRRGKIVATLGPASDSAEMIEALLHAGVDVFRLNFSHGEHADHALRVKRIRAAETKLGRPIAIMADVQGPKLRIGKFSGEAVHLQSGQSFQLDMSPTPGDVRRVQRPHPEIMAAAMPSSVLLLDDGKIRLEVTRKRENVLETHIINGGRLSDRKGVNVPDTDMPIAALTDEDLVTLDFIAEHVDIVAMSFVRSARDIADLQRALAARTQRTIGVVAKIETPQACRALPDILLELMKCPPCGVMLARGDLGVEIGFEHLPEAQDEILALCEAAHVPVIWATQVLESMTEHGFPTRGEVTDAADAARVNVVGGSEISVSACGGYTLGGGHSWSGPAYGMAVDNLLSVEAVLANGSVVTASACENADLFWALRGGAYAHTVGRAGLARQQWRRRRRRRRRQRRRERKPRRCCAL